MITSHLSADPYWSFNLPTHDELVWLGLRRWIWIEWLYSSSDAFGGYYVYFDEYCICGLLKEEKVQKAKQRASWVYNLLTAALLVPLNKARFHHKYWETLERELQLKNDQIHFAMWAQSCGVVVTEVSMDEIPPNLDPWRYLEKRHRAKCATLAGMAVSLLALVFTWAALFATVIAN